MEKIVLAQYKLYLELGGITEDQMSPPQRRETKRAFFAGFGQSIMYVKDNTPDDEKQAVKLFKSMIDEVHQFFVDETVKQNHGLSPQ